MLIAIDHGNSEIKTIHEAFASGVIQNPSMPQMASDWIEYEGNTYALTGEHMAYRRDKTQTGDYYILTLFAIAKELSLVGIREANVHLAIGLPPAHMLDLKGCFTEYLVREKQEVSFRYNEQDLKIRITGASVFPQGYPAVYDRYEEITLLPKAYIVDVGGYTTDVLLLRYGRLDLNCCYSLESGIIKLFIRAASILVSRFGGTVDESDLRGVLSGRETLLTKEMCEIVRQTAGTHANAPNSLAANDIDLNFAPSYFIGGGALLLREFFDQTGRLAKAVYITDTLANAKGYAVMARALLSEGKGESE